MSKKLKPKTSESLCLPKKIRVFGKDFSVGKAYLEQGFQDCGQTDEGKLSILIRDGQPKIEEADTLLHESIHAIDFVMDLELTERQVRLLATGLIGVFQDNPEFAEFVTKQH